MSSRHAKLWLRDSEIAIQFKIRADLHLLLSMQKVVIRANQLISTVIVPMHNRTWT